MTDPLTLTRRSGDDLSQASTVCSVRLGGRQEASQDGGGALWRSATKSETVPPPLQSQYVPLRTVVRHPDELSIAVPSPHSSYVVTSCHLAPEAFIAATLPCQRIRSRARKGAVPYVVPAFQKHGENENEQAEGAGERFGWALAGPDWCQPSIVRLPAPLAYGWRPWTAW